MNYLENIKDQIIKEELVKVGNLDPKFVNLFVSYYYQLSALYQEGKIEEFNTVLETLVEKLKNVFEIRSQEKIISQLMIVEKLEEILNKQINEINFNLLLHEKDSKTYGMFIIQMKNFVESVLNILNLLMTYHIKK